MPTRVGGRYLHDSFSTTFLQAKYVKFKDLLEMMGPRKIILPRYIVLYQGKARTQKRLT
jgi:hypothetical protein